MTVCYESTARLTLTIKTISQILSWYINGYKNMYGREEAPRKSHHFAHRYEKIESKTSFCHNKELIPFSHYHYPFIH